MVVDKGKAKAKEEPVKEGRELNDEGQREIDRFVPWESNPYPSLKGSRRRYLANDQALGSGRVPLSPRSTGSSSYNSSTSPPQSAGSASSSSTNFSPYPPNHFSVPWHLYHLYRPVPPQSFFSRILSFHSSHSPSPQFGTILDLGCGTGFPVVSQLGLKNFDRYLGIDLNTSQLEVGSKQWAKEIEKGRVKFIKGRGEDLSWLDDRSVDMIVVGEAVHWFDGLLGDDPEQGGTGRQEDSNFWREVGRVLKPGGTLAIWVYTMSSILENPPANSIFHSFLLSTLLPPRSNNSKDAVFQSLLDALPIPESLFLHETRLKWLLPQVEWPNNVDRIADDAAKQKQRQKRSHGEKPTASTTNGVTSERKKSHSQPYSSHRHQDNRKSPSMLEIHLPDSPQSTPLTSSPLSSSDGARTFSSSLKSQRSPRTTVTPLPQIPDSDDRATSPALSITTLASDYGTGPTSPLPPNLSSPPSPNIEDSNDERESKDTTEITPTISRHPQYSSDPKLLREITWPNRHHPTHCHSSSVIDPHFLGRWWSIHDLEEHLKTLGSVVECELDKDGGKRMETMLDAVGWWLEVGRDGERQLGWDQEATSVDRVKGEIAVPSQRGNEQYAYNRNTLYSEVSSQLSPQQPPKRRSSESAATMPKSSKKSRWKELGKRLRGVGSDVEEEKKVLVSWPLALVMATRR